MAVLWPPRALSSVRLWRTMFALLLAIMSWQAVGIAQNVPASTEVQLSPPPDAQPVSSGTDQPAANASAQPAASSAPNPTTSLAESAAQPAPVDGANGAATLSAAKPSAPPNVAPGTLNHGATVPAKYDVSQIGQRNVGNGLDFYSLDREVALGRELSAEVEQSARLVTDPIITEYVNRIGQNLVRNSDARVPFTIKVLDTDEVNAFALPGGFFYVNSGLILAADNEAELAGVMAHEIAHVAARHATKNMTRAQIWNMASIPLIFIGGPVAYAISEVAGLAVPLGFLKFSRDAEREADLLGLQYDYAAGYDPEAFVEFFEKLKLDEKKKQNIIAKAFATHPMNADRIKAAQDEIRQYLPDRPEYVVDTSEFENVKTRLYSLENGRHLGGAKSEPGRPVLLKRTSTGDSGSSTGSGSGTTSQADDSRPTLKRAPGAGSGSGGSSSGSNPNDTSTTSGQGSDGPPTLKRTPPSSD